MLFETLLWECFAGPSRLEDAALGAVVQSAKQASTIAFRIDTPAFRDAMGLGSIPLCDGLFLGLRKDGDQEGRVHCVFVELKGKDIGHAVEQIANAIRAVRAHLGGTLSESALLRTRFAAVIVSDRASPEYNVSREDIRRFWREFRSPLYVRPAQRRGSPADLTFDLWGPVT